jgi:hypothetical protein
MEPDGNFIMMGKELHEMTAITSPEKLFSIKHISECSPLANFNTIM